MAMRAGIAQIDIWYRTRLTDPFIPGRPLGASLVPPKVLEPIWRHFSISHCVLDISVAHVVLEGSSVMSVIGELVAGGVPKHVGVDREWEFSCFSCPSYRF